MECSLTQVAVVLPIQHTGLTFSDSRERESEDMQHNFVELWAAVAPHQLTWDKNPGQWKQLF